MAIPLFGAQAHGGKIISLDDQSVVKDRAALAGTGGSSYAPYVLSTLVVGRDLGGYARLRRLVQRVPHDGGVVVKVTPWRDGADTGRTITRTLVAADNPTVVAPLSETGSAFQVKIELSSFDAPASLGSGALTINPRRVTR